MRVQKMGNIWLSHPSIPLGVALWACHGMSCWRAMCELLRLLCGFIRVGGFGRGLDTSACNSEE